METGHYYQKQKDAISLPTVDHFSYDSGKLGSLDNCNLTS